MRFVDEGSPRCSGVYEDRCYVHFKETYTGALGDWTFPVKYGIQHTSSAGSLFDYVRYMYVEVKFSVNRDFEIFYLTRPRDVRIAYFDWWDSVGFCAAEDYRYGFQRIYPHTPFLEPL